MQTEDEVLNLYECNGCRRLFTRELQVVHINEYSEQWCKTFPREKPLCPVCIDTAKAQTIEAFGV